MNFKNFIIQEWEYQVSNYLSLITSGQVTNFATRWQKNVYKIIHLFLLTNENKYEFKILRLIFNFFNVSSTVFFKNSINGKCQNSSFEKKNQFQVFLLP